MIKTALAIAIAAAAAGATLFAAAPAAAQSRDRVLVIYGNDKCPVSSGQEINICVKKPESERYRIPEELRDAAKGIGRWADRAQSLEYVGRTGTGSCSPVGPGGASGCYNQLVRQAREENKENGVDTAVKF